MISYTELDEEWGQVKALVLGSSPSELTTQNKEVAGYKSDFKKCRCDTKVIHAHPPREFS
jgi:hypothetical protein